MIDIALIVYASLILISVLLYAPRIVGIRYGFKKLKRYVAKERRKIGVIVPARNESEIIGDLFDSISKQDYDREYFEVFVIVKEPDDPTIDIAKKYGYSVTVIQQQTCKGEALDGLFKSVSPEQLNVFDAFVIVDADGVIAPNYIRELNNALEYPADIFVTRKLAKNFLRGKECRSVYSNCAALTWPMLDDLGNAFRTEKGMPLNLCGQGLLVRRKVIESLDGWPYRTITEDYELKIDGIILKGFKSAYYPHALIYTEEAIGRKENFIRRVRWLTGYSQCDSKYKEQIKQQIKVKKRLNLGEVEYFFGIVSYLFFLISTVLATLAGVAFAIYYAVTGSALWLNSLLLLVVTPIAVLYFVLFVYTLIALVASRGSFRMITASERIAMVFYNPIYILEYLGAYIKGRFDLLSKKNVEWKQTERIVKNQNK